MNKTRAAVAFIMFFSIYGGGNFYIAIRLYQWLNLLFANINAMIYAGIFIFLVLSMFLAFWPLPLNVKKILTWVSAYWIGMFVYLLVFIFLADIVILLGWITGIIPDPIPQSVLFYRGATAVSLTAGVIGYGIYNANRIKLVSYEIQLKQAALNNLRIVLISDLHLGDVNSENNLERMVKKINDLNPDIVCIAGDIFNDNFYNIRDPDRAVALFGSIEARYGVFACLGNHDGGGTLSQMKNFLKESKIKLLNDEYVIIDERFALFGRLDSSPIRGFGELRRQNISDDIAAVGANMPVIVMEHSPAHIREYNSEVDLILAGHTHGGQIFPGGLITRAMFTVDYGHYQKDENSPHVIVTSGASTWRPPMRIGTNNEIVSIILR